MQRKSKIFLYGFIVFLLSFTIFTRNAIAKSKEKAKDKNKKKVVTPVVTPAAPPAPKKVEDDIPVLPHGDESPHASMMFYVTPEISNVNLTPPAPKPNAPVVISASIFNNPDLTDISVTQSAALAYSVDSGKTWQPDIPMQKDSAGKVWSAAIPKQKKGTKVQYFIKAADNTGNFAIEIPPSAVLDENALTQVAADADDPKDWVPDDIDILNLSVGYNADKIIVRLKVNGRFSNKGKEDNMIHAYAVPLINPDIPTTFDLLTAKALVYAPAMQFMGAEPFGLYSLQAFMGGKIVDALVKDAGVKIMRDIEKSPDTITFEFSRTALGSNPSASFKVGALTLGFADIKELSTTPWDATTYTMVYMRSHEYEVK